MLSVFPDELFKQSDIPGHVFLHVSRSCGEVDRQRPYWSASNEQKELSVAHTFIERGDMYERPNRKSNVDDQCQYPLRDALRYFADSSTAIVA
jgi:hypothetical protein